MSSHTLSQQQRAGLVFHGLLVIMLGFFGGMAWIIVLGEYLQFWPLPGIELDLPDNKELWRNAHTGPIMNGVLAIGLAAVSPFIHLSKKMTNAMYSAIVIMIWFNTMGYSVAPFSSNRGLNPSGGFLNALTYFPFYIAALSAIFAVALGIVGSYKAMKTSSSENDQ